MSETHSLHLPVRCQTPDSGLEITALEAKRRKHVLRAGARRRHRGPRLFVPRMRQAWAGHLMEPFHAETSVLQLVGRNVDVSLISLPQVIKTKQQNLGNEAH